MNNYLKNKSIQQSLLNILPNQSKINLLHILQNSSEKQKAIFRARNTTKQLKRMRNSINSNYSKNTQQYLQNLPIYTLNPTKRYKKLNNGWVSSTITRKSNVPESQIIKKTSQNINNKLLARFNNLFGEKNEIIKKYKTAYSSFNSNFNKNKLNNSSYFVKLSIGKNANKIKKNALNYSNKLKYMKKFNKIEQNLYKISNTLSLSEKLNLL